MKKFRTRSFGLKWVGLLLSLLSEDRSRFCFRNTFNLYFKQWNVAKSPQWMIPKYIPFFFFTIFNISKTIISRSFEHSSQLYWQRQYPSNLGGKIHCLGASSFFFLLLLILILLLLFFSSSFSSSSPPPPPPLSSPPPHHCSSSPSCYNCITFTKRRGCLFAFLICMTTVY